MYKATLEQSLNKYFKELPEYEKLTKEVGETARMLAYSIFVKAVEDESFMNNVLGMGTEGVRVVPDNKIFTRYLEIYSPLTIEQTTEMNKDEILVNKRLYKLPMELDLGVFIKTLYRHHELYGILECKGFNYKDTKHFSDKIFSDTDVKFSVCFESGAADAFEVEYPRLTYDVVYLEDIHTDIKNPSMLEKILCKLLNKKPITTFAIVLNIKYSI